MNRPSLALVVVSLLLVAAGPTSALPGQSPATNTGTPEPSSSSAMAAKEPLTHEAYDSWKSIRGETLSADGAWLLYAEVPQDGDSTLVVRNLGAGTEHRHSLGWLTPSDTTFPQPSAEFSRDSTHVVFLSSPARADVKAARKENKKPAEMPQASMGILDLATGAVATVERVRSFAMPAEAGGWLAYLHHEPLPEKSDEDGEEEGEAPTEEPAAEPAPEATGEQTEEEGEDEDEKEKEYGTELVLRDLGTDAETRTPSVLEYRFLDDGGRLFYTVSSEEEPGSDGVYALEPGTATVHALQTGEGNYTRFAIDEDQTRIAFLTDTADYASDEPVFELFGMGVGDSSAELWVSHASTVGFPDGMAVSDKEPVAFTDDGGMILFGIKERPMPSGDDESEQEEEEEVEEARFDLWHWNDPYPQPQQLILAEGVRNETWESVYHLDSGRFVQLADELIPDVSLADDGSIAFGQTSVPHTKKIAYDGRYVDVYVIDPATGERTLIKEEAFRGASLSPGGAYVVWFDTDLHWYVHDVAGGETRNLTADLPVPFDRQDWDTPSTPGSYGLGGWTVGDEAVLIYDEFDIWEVKADGSGTRVATEGFGRDNNLSFRYLRVDPEEESIDPSATIFLTATNTETMATGFFTDVIGGEVAPEERMMADARLTFRGKADDADVLLYTRQTFAEYPDLWITGTDFAEQQRVSELGAQTEPYVWGRAELRDFYSADGVPLKGILVTPEDFDSDREYPLMVYIYETLHQGLHSFRNPSPGTSINPSYYVSNGYVLWMPDIEYTTGYPGRDALKCVLPGVNMLVREGFVDPEAIGIQGHSWGGYQISYMVTQTDIFAAAEAGAPVSNMTSAYGGIRWGSGMVRQFQYERTQSRLGASLWDVPLRYIENSPLFWADKINTPLLILHNDDDGAVPWYQGIELIMAMRRLEREGYMFNYNGEAHGLRRRVNQKDWTIRMEEFFAHHLKGEPAPAWMTDGIMGWDKGESDE